MTVDETPRPWWKEPMVWLVAGLPATAVIAGFTTYFIAAHEADTLMDTSFRKEGLVMVQKATPADQAAARMGLRAHMTLQDGMLTARLLGQEAAPPERLRLSIHHPTREDLDIHLLLYRDAGGNYVASLPDLGSSRRTLILAAEDQSWRITGQWAAPFTGSLELKALASNTSTTTHAGTEKGEH